MMADYPVGIRLYDMLFDGARMCVRCRSTPGGHGWRRGTRARGRTGWICPS